MIQIDLKRLREALPENGTIYIRFTKKKPRSLYLECWIKWPSLSERFPLTYEKEYEKILQWQEEIIGKEAISEFYTEQTGHEWHVYLKRVPIEFLNCTDQDIKDYSGYTKQELTSGHIQRDEN